MPVVQSKSLHQFYGRNESLKHVTDDSKFYDRRLRYIFGRHKHKHWWNRKESLRKSKPVKEDQYVTPVPYYRLFRFLTCKDVLLWVLGFTAALICSVCLPAVNVLFAKIAELFVQHSMVEEEPVHCNGSTQIFPKGNGTSKAGNKKIDLMHEMGIYSISLCVVGTLNLIFSYIFVSIFNRVGENQIYRLRVTYMSSLLQQNIGWYDTVEDRNFISRISENISKVQEAISDKVGMFFYFSFSSITSIAAAFYYGWLMTLVMLSIMPIIIVSIVVITKVQARLALREQSAYAKAGYVAQEALSNIKTVMAFSGQMKEIERFEDSLKYAIRAGRLRGIFSGCGNGLLWFLNYCSYSLGFWYGTQLVFHDNPCKKDPRGNYGPAEMMMVFFSIMAAAFNMGQAMSYTEVFTIGCGAAAAVYKVIDRVPEIDSYSTKGLKPSERSKGKIEFRDVTFSYPSRKDVKILNGLNLVIEPGTTVALVGNSGSGKSTCIQLIQRFYDPDNGSISVDGVSLTDLNISWCRSQFGVVSQEPILFNSTIAENIRYGKTDASQQEIEDACKLSNAHAFIAKLPQGYETRVGERGAQLSGGQKQRIAIARALIRNPPILLLDEATSALDTQSESIVQEALEKASMGRTTIIVAHRLSTIRNADVIVSLQNGVVLETGTHETLLTQKGLYFKLVTAQTRGNLEGHVDEVPEKIEESLKLIPEQTEDADSFDAKSESLAQEETIKEVAKRASFFKLLRLSGDAASVQGATGMRLGMVTQAIVTIVSSIGLGMYILPKLGGFAVAFMPIILVASYYNIEILETQQIEEKLATEEASSYAFQAVSGIRTVQGLCKEKKFIEMYSQALLPPYKKAVRNSHILGLVSGLSQSLVYLIYGAVIYYGAYLVLHEGAKFQHILILTESLVWTMLTLGQTIAFAPNYGRAKVAGGRILSLLGRKSSIDSSSNVGEIITTCEGRISFDNIEFTYPTRKDTKILKGLTVDFEPYKHFGICGPSGGGKSTCIQLILRYYDPASGKVLLDGMDIRSLNLSVYRSQLAIVSQEPALFDRTLAENIAYGDNSRDVSMDEIIEAAKSANIHSFISSLPNGYLTN
ncbi:unnamed protein product, partial [Allacma fusca]